MQKSKKIIKFILSILLAFSLCLLSTLKPAKASPNYDNTINTEIKNFENKYYQYNILDNYILNNLYAIELQLPFPYVNHKITTISNNSCPNQPRSLTRNIYLNGKFVSQQNTLVRLINNTNLSSSYCVTENLNSDMTQNITIVLDDYFNKEEKKELFNKIFNFNNSIGLTNTIDNSLLHIEYNNTLHLNENEKIGIDNNYSTLYIGFYFYNNLYFSFNGFNIYASETNINYDSQYMPNLDYVTDSNTNGNFSLKTNYIIGTNDNTSNVKAVIAENERIVTFNDNSFYLVFNGLGTQEQEGYTFNLSFNFAFYDNASFTAGYTSSTYNIVYDECKWYNFICHTGNIINYVIYDMPIVSNVTILTIAIKDMIVTTWNFLSDASGLQFIFMVCVLSVSLHLIKKMGSDN